MEERFYIFDCLGIVVGNVHGYATMRGANIGLSKIKKKLWKRFYDCEKSGKLKYRANMVYCIGQHPFVN